MGSLWFCIGGGTDSQAIDSNCQWIEVMESGVLGVLDRVPTGLQWFQMEQQQIHSYSHLGSCWFHTGGQQTLKPLNFILGIVKLCKGVFQLFSFRVQLVSNNSRWHSHKFTPIVICVPTDSALGENRLPSFWISFSVDRIWGKGYSGCFKSGSNQLFPIIPDGTAKNPPLLGGEWTFKLLIVIVSELKLQKGSFQVFPIRFQVIYNNSRWHSSQSTSIHIWAPGDYAFWDNTLTSLWISFTGYQGCGKGYLSCSNPDPNWFLTMPDGTAMNLPLLSSGFPLILHWGRPYPQAFWSHSQEFGAVKRGISAVFI